MVFLNASIAIDFVEQPIVWGPEASARLGDLRASAETFAATELVRMECLVGPIKTGDAAMLADFMSFFAALDLAIRSITMAVAQCAATIRATDGFRPMDSLHLATATDHGCGLFLTNDVLRRRYPDITVEVLT
jgi:predicted nucleic acid-binding protein